MYHWTVTYILNTIVYIELKMHLSTIIQWISGCLFLALVGKYG